MALKYKYMTKQDIPAEQQSLYVEREGAFYLDAEGVTDPASVEELRRASKARADEMRNHNIELRKQIEERDARFEGIDPDEFRRLVEEKRKLELQAQGHKPEEIEKLVTDRLKGLKADWDKQQVAVAN